MPERFDFDPMVAGCFLLSGLADCRETGLTVSHLTGDMSGLGRRWAGTIWDTTGPGGLPGSVLGVRLLAARTG